MIEKNKFFSERTLVYKGLLDFENEVIISININNKRLGFDLKKYNQPSFFDDITVTDLLKFGVENNIKIALLNSERITFTPINNNGKENDYWYFVREENILILVSFDEVQHSLYEVRLEGVFNII